MDRYEQRRLSKTLAHALRHAPQVYGIELDSQGWTSLMGLLSGLRRHRKGWAGLTRADLEAIVKGPGKQRYAIQDDRIRALYGHSQGVLAIEKAPTQPPDVLYHGTSPHAATLIAEEGLQPMTRQYVHHAVDEVTALQVGRRKGEKVVILRVNAQAAYAEGVQFYRGNAQTWLSDAIPPRFIGFPSVGESP